MHILSLTAPAPSATQSQSSLLRSFFLPDLFFWVTTPLHSTPLHSNEEAFSAPSDFSAQGVKFDSNPGKNQVPNFLVHYIGIFVKQLLINCNLKKSPLMTTVPPLPTYVADGRRQHVAWLLQHYQHTRSHARPGSEATCFFSCGWTCTLSPPLPACARCDVISEAHCVWSAYHSYTSKMLRIVAALNWILIILFGIM